MNRPTLSFRVILLVFLLFIQFLLISCSQETGPVLEHLFEAPQFELTDCFDEPLKSQDLEGKVWIVDFIFTRCQGPCPLMTQKLKSIQNELKSRGLIGADSEVLLVSISVDPAYDTPGVLLEYARTWKVDLDSWRFATGPEEETLRLIQEGFKATAVREGSGSEMDHEMPSIMHSTNFLLVDQEGWIRRIYHLTDEDLTRQISSDVESLLSGSS